MRAFLAAALLLSASARAAEPGAAAIVGWYEDVFSAAERDPERVRLTARASWFAMTSAEQEAILRSTLTTWDGAQPRRSLVEVADAGRGTLYRWDGMTLLPLATWDATRRRAEAAGALRGDKRFFLGLTGNQRFSEDMDTVALGLRAGTYLFKGVYDASVGLDMSAVKSKVAQPGSTSGTTSSTSTSTTSYSFMFRRHIVIPDNKAVRPSVGAQVLMPEGGDSQPAAVIGVGIQPNPKSMGIIDFTASLGSETQSFVIGYTLLVL